MNEFALIDTYFKRTDSDPAVVVGVGDDAACLRIPAHHMLVVGTDTMVEGVHFPRAASAYDVASRLVRVNVSDLAAMGAVPRWASLAMTLPCVDTAWLEAFSAGLWDALNGYEMHLIGGDTTRGACTLTLTVQGLALEDAVVLRSGARAGDSIFVTGTLGGAALFYTAFTEPVEISAEDTLLLGEKFWRPKPRLDYVPYLRAFASSAIDISDGLAGDLGHICTASGVAAILFEDAIPVHPLLQRYQRDIFFALEGGDDYELCFTVPAAREADFLLQQADYGLDCTKIGTIVAGEGIQLSRTDHSRISLLPRAYQHF